MSGVHIEHNNIQFSWSYHFCIVERGIRSGGKSVGLGSRSDGVAFAPHSTTGIARK